MGKIITHADLKGHKFYKHEHIVKIMYDDNEPPKNYLWHKPNDILYEYIDGEWRPINRHAKGDFITREELKRYIKEEILGKIASIIDINPDDFLKIEDLIGYATQDWVNQQDFGKNIDLSDYITAEDVD